MKSHNPKRSIPSAPVVSGLRGFVSRLSRAGCSLDSFDEQVSSRAFRRGQALTPAHSGGQENVFRMPETSPFPSPRLVWGLLSSFPYVSGSAQRILIYDHEELYFKFETADKSEALEGV